MSKRQIALQGTGLWAGQSWDSERHLFIGRMPSCDVVIDDTSISRRHAEIFHTDSGWVVRDIGSTNGTFLNGSRLGRIPQRLRQGDQLQPGKVILIVKGLQDEAAPASCMLDDEDVGAAIAQRRPDADARDAASGGAARSRTQATPVSGHTLGDPIGRGDSLGDFLAISLRGAVDSLAAQGGAILLSGDNSGKIVLKATSCPRHPGRQRSYFATLVKRCYRQAQPILCRDVLELAEATDSAPDGAIRSVLCVPLYGAHAPRGVLSLDRACGQEPFDERDQQLAQAVANTLAAGIASTQLLLDQQRHLFMQTVLTLAQAVDCRDPYTAGHTQRVTDYALLLAESLSVSSADYHLLQIGTPLHDIGKIGIDDAILRKPGRLTPAEFEEIQSHPLKGVAMLETIPDLAPVLPIVRSHHEAWNGTGYPDGLIEEGIPPLVRMVTIADVFDALTSDRPYRKALTPADAFAYVQKNAGTLFDPHFSQAFLQLRPRLEKLLRDRGAVTATVSRRELDRLKETMQGSGVRRLVRPS
jgi:HD-GYP domain-containing protein (c-di-GMP phosphodiesterase class II)